MSRVLFFPTSDLPTVDAFDDDELVAGYRAGLHGEPMPTSQAGQHGWRNGLIDSGRSKITWRQQRLAVEYVQVHGNPLTGGKRN